MEAPIRWMFRIEGPDGAKRSVSVPHDLIIGRDAAVDLLLNDSSVSRRHAKVSLDANGTLFIEDLGSANGVKVDDARIAQRVALADGALLTLGLYRLIAERVETSTVPDRGERKHRPQQLRSTSQDVALKPVLRFKNGPLAGQTVTLLKPVVVLGRIAEGNDIVVADESVSRQHARFTQVGRGYEVHDLKSVNGTFVNGARVTFHALKDGDQLVLGVVEAAYVGPGAKSARLLDRRNVKRLLLGATLTMVVLLLIEGIQLWRSHLAHVKAEQRSEEDVTRSLEDSLAEAKRARNEQRWDFALQAYQEALAQDPMNPTARQGLDEVKTEIDMKRLFERAQQRVDVGQDEDAVALYLQIDSTSDYYPRARAEVRRLAENLKRRYDEQCKQAQRVSDLKAILLSCTNYLNLVCNSAPDPARLRMVRAAEKRRGVHVKVTPWSCPPAYAHWFSDDVVSGSSPLGQRIAQKYSDPAVAQAMDAYAVGDARAAAQLLTKAKHDSLVEGLGNNFQLADSAYREGATALGTGDWRSAKARWQTLFEIDAQIMPSGDEGALATSARSQLAKQFYSLGRDQFVAGNLEEAYRDWEMGLAFGPDDRDLLQGFSDLEHQSEAHLVSSANCGDLLLAAKITRPASTDHKKAAQLMKDHRCGP